MPTNKKDYWSKNWWANYKKYQWTAEAKKQRASRNWARAAAVKSWRIKKWSKMEIDHKKPLSKGGSTAKSNTRVISRKTNRKLWAAIANKKKRKGYKKAK